MCADMYFHVDGDYENALRLYKEALWVGDEFAAFKIGEMYYKGLGVEKDYHKSFEFFRNYNSLDDAPIKVYYMLAEMYQNGWGVEQNSEEAEKLFRAAEKRGGIEYDN